MAEFADNTMSPQNPTERKLVEIWAESLETNEIALHENFVDLGGDSLSATLCISRIHKIWGVDFSIEDFFAENATIRQFAESIERSGRTTA